LVEKKTLRPESVDMNCWNISFTI